MFIRYSQANAIKWPKPILYTVKGGGTIPNSNVTSTDRAQILHVEGGLESKWRVYEWICLIKPTQYRGWQNVCFCAALSFRDRNRHRRAPSPPKHTCTQTQLHTHTSSSHLQPREVMKTNGRVLFPLGPEEELSHQANFILVWPRDSISSGCFYKCRAAPRHRPVMDMRAWWPDGRCWPCNSSSKHSLMTPLAPRASLTQWNVAAWKCTHELVLSKQTVLLFSMPRRLFRAL